jgi:hypothetical protein
MLLYYQLVGFFLGASKSSLVYFRQKKQRRDLPPLLSIKTSGATAGVNRFRHAVTENSDSFFCSFICLYS